MKSTTGNRKVQWWTFITVNYCESVSDFHIFVLCHFQETSINIISVTGPFIRKCLEISFWPSLSALQALTRTESHASLLDKEVRRKWAGTHQREPRIIGRDSPPCTRSLRGLITEIQRKEENKKTGECGCQRLSALRANIATPALWRTDGACLAPGSYRFCEGVISAETLSSWYFLMAKRSSA